MKSSKPAKDIVPGDKIYLDTAPAMPKEVTESYALGERWALVVSGLPQIIQVNPDDLLQTWGQ